MTGPSPRKQLAMPMSEAIAPATGIRCEANLGQDHEPVNFAATLEARDRAFRTEIGMKPEAWYTDEVFDLPVAPEQFTSRSVVVEKLIRLRCCKHCGLVYWEPQA